MTIDLTARGLRAVLLDIEGTTTPIAFVHDVLFPYARAHVREFLRARGGDDEVKEATSRLIVEHAEDSTRADAPPPLNGADDESIARYVEWLIDRDRKSPGLKLLQGFIWEQGYQAGQLRGEIFPDVAPALRRWHAAGIRIAIYSSGSALAQKRLFASTSAGDLTGAISGFFDTAVGAKRSAASYAAICEQLGVDKSSVLFVSDVVFELDAASAAGMPVCLSLRPGNEPQPDVQRYDQITSFDEIVVSA